MRLSVLTPVYDESAGVRRLYDEIRSTLGAVRPAIEIELLFIDDGSRDDTFAHLAELAASDPAVKVIRLAANRGSHAALRAGLRFASGDCAVYVPCDLQEPPALVARLLDAADGEVQVVWAVRETRRDPLVARVCSRVFHALAARLEARRLPHPIGTFLVRRAAIDALNARPSSSAAIEVSLHELGLPAATVGYRRRPRRSGASKWTVAARVRHGLAYLRGARGAAGVRPAADAIAELLNLTTTSGAR